MRAQHSLEEHDDIDGDNDDYIVKDQVKKRGHIEEKY